MYIWFPSNIFLFIKFPNISISNQPQPSRYIMKISYLPIIDMKASHNLPLGYACREFLRVYSISRMMLNNFFFFLINWGNSIRKIHKYTDTSANECDCSATVDLGCNIFAEHTDVRNIIRRIFASCT